MKSPRTLVVCTANICRSPVVAVLLQRTFDRHIQDGVVRSAGTSGGHLEVHRHTVAAASRLGIDISEHESRMLTTELLATDGADLVITMTHDHTRAAVNLSPEIWERTFTLRELVRIAEASGPRQTTFNTWVTTMAEERDRSDLFRRDKDDDLDDPYGGPASGHRRMVNEVAELVERLALVAFPFHNTGQLPR